MDSERIAKYNMQPKELLKASVADIIIEIYNQISNPKVIAEDVILGKVIKGEGISICTKYIENVGYINVIKEKKKNVYSNYYVTEPVSKITEYIPLAWKHICDRYNEDAYDENKDYNAYYEDIMNSDFSEELKKGRVFKPDNSKGITYKMALYRDKTSEPCLYISDTEEIPLYGFLYFERGIWYLDL